MSVDSSSEQWSFENLTQTTDSSYHPFTTGGNNNNNKSDSLKNLNLPLSLVLNPDIRSTTTGHPTRSPSNSSARGTHLLRRQVGRRPDSLASDTLSLHHSPQQYSSQQRLLCSKSQQSMFSGTTSESAGRTSESVASPVNPQGVRRESVYSDRAVFALSRSPERSLRPYGSTSPPPTMPPAAYSRPSDGSGRTSTGNRAYGSDDQLPNSPYLQQPQSRYQQRQQSHEQSPRQQSHEQDSRQQSIVALSGRPQTRGEPAAASKSYGLPATSDAVGRAQNDPYRRARVERDYSQGESRQFSVTMPEQLNGRIDEQQFKKFVRRLNRLLAEAEGATLRNVLEGCLAYATLYVSTLLLKPHSKKIVERISAFVARENKELFEPAGLLVIDPLQTAYMFIEIVVL